MGLLHNIVIAVTGRGPLLRSNRQLMPITEAECCDLIRVLEGKGVTNERRQDLAKKLRARL